MKLGEVCSVSFDYLLKFNVHLWNIFRIHFAISLTCIYLNTLIYNEAEGGHCLALPEKTQMWTLIIAPQFPFSLYLY